jgi:hypothetical protein
MSESKTASAEVATESKVQKATDDFNKKLDLEHSLLARIEALRNRIQKIIEDSKKNEPKEGEEKEEKKKPEPPMPIPEPGTPGHQVLPLLFGLAFILIKIMNQENLNRQSIYNMNNYFEYLTIMIQVYQKLSNTAATKGYPLKTDLLINSLKSFYAYFYMAVSDKMQKLFTSPGYESTEWISTLSPEEDKKFASMEFMNVIDDLFKDIHPAFEYMVEDYQVTDPLTIESMKKDMEKLKEGNSNEGNSKEEVKKGGAVPNAAPSAASNSASSSAISEDDATEEKKGPIVFTKSPVPDEGCELGKPCQRKIDELKTSADAQTDQLNQVLEKGLTTVTMEAITQAVGNLSYDAKDIHISMVERLEPPADNKTSGASKEAIQKIIVEIRSLVGTIPGNIDKWIGNFEKAKAATAAKPFAEEMIKELYKLKDKLIIQKTNGSVLPDVPKLLDEMDTLLKQPMDLLKSMSEGVQKFQELLQKMKVLSGLLEQNQFDEKSQAAIKGADANLMKTIDQIKALMPAMKEKGGLSKAVSAIASKVSGALKSTVPPATPRPSASAAVSTEEKASLLQSNSLAESRNDRPLNLKTQETRPAAPASNNEGAPLLQRGGGKRVLRRSRKASKPTAKKTLRRR